MNRALPRLLNVDDTEPMRYAKTRTLRQAGFEVIEASRGKEALELVSTCRPALVVLDVRLPDMSGVEVCRSIKRDFPDTLVLQVSASFVASEARIRGLESGADFYLAQPAEPGELVAAVRALLRLRSAEQAVRESEERNRLILESAVDYAIFTTDLTGKVTSWNVGASRLLGYSEAEILGGFGNFSSAEAATAEGDADPEMERALADGRSEYEGYHRRKDLSLFWGNGLTMPLRDHGGRTVGFLKILRDRTAQKAVEDDMRTLTETLELRVAERTQALAQANRSLVDEALEREKAETRLRQSQKMEAVGQLTGGIAHDFNNLLSAVMGSLELIIRRTTEENVAKLASAAIASVERGAKLTGQLLTFSRMQRLDLASIDPNRLIDGMRDLLDRSLGPEITLKLMLDDQIGSVLTDANQLELAILNLAINARDAMPEGGDLEIATDGKPMAVPGITDPSAFVCISVRDSGVGMPPEVADRAFEPFYTTKALGKGTGLGLSQVYGIAKQSGGIVAIDTVPGHGTTVRIMLPRTKPVQDLVEETAKPCLTELRPANPQTLVLVVDDDTDVRHSLVQILESLKYRVVEAAHGLAGLQALSRAVPDVAIVDYAMPGMTGAEFARSARKIVPLLPIIFATGYADTATLDGSLSSIPLLRKPFRATELVASINNLLIPVKSSDA